MCYKYDNYGCNGFLLKRPLYLLLCIELIQLPSTIELKRSDHPNVLICLGMFDPRNWFHSAEDFERLIKIARFRSRFLEQSETTERWVFIYTWHLRHNYYFCCSMTIKLLRFSWVSSSTSIYTSLVTIDASWIVNEQLPIKNYAIAEHLIKWVGHPAVKVWNSKLTISKVKKFWLTPRFDWSQIHTENSPTGLH